MDGFVASSDRCYDNAYETFLQYTDLHHAIQQCFKSNLPNVLQQINASAKKPLNILSIGAGNGQMDEKFLETVMDLQGPTSKSVFIRAIEPSSESIEQYQHRVEERTSCHDPLILKASFEFVNKDFDEYTVGNSDLRIQFDLIQAVHSFYFVKDVQKSLLHCYESELKSKGAIMLIARRENVSTFRKLALYLADNIDSYSGTLQYMGSEGFVEIAERCKYEYDVLPFNYSIDVTEIFYPNSPMGQLLLDFFTFQKDFRGSCDKNVVQGVCDIIRNAAKEDENGRLILEVLDELVVIYKPSLRSQF